jgi:DNA-binding NtrC family response regulator
MSRINQTAGLTPEPAGRGGKIPQMVKNSPKLRVLVVDDEPLIRWSLAETLEERGYAVLEAGNRQETLEALSTVAEPFDVILLDYRLPDSNDLSLLETIRKIAPKTAVIMMTAFGTPEVLAGAVALGAYRVVAKPFEVHDIAALVLQAHDALQ